MDFQQLYQIMTIAQTGSISKAAEVLYMTQSALSHALLKEEASLGVKLFDRSSYPLTLTYAGEKYIEMAQQIQMLYREYEKLCCDINHEKAGKLHIGVPYHRAAQLIVPVISEFKQQYPKISLDFSANDMVQLYEDMNNGLIDFCVQVHLENEPTFEYLPLFKEEMFFLAPKGIVKPEHLLTPDCIALSALPEYPLILHNKNSGSRKFLRAFSQAYHMILQPALTVPNNQLILSMVGEGLGCTLLSHNVLRYTVHSPDIQRYSISKHGIGWEVCAIHSQKHHLSECETFLLDLIRQKLPQQPDLTMEVFPKFSIQQ